MIPIYLRAPDEASAIADALVDATFLRRSLPGGGSEWATDGHGWAMAVLGTVTNKPGEDDTRFHVNLELWDTPEVAYASDFLTEFYAGPGVEVTRPNGTQIVFPATPSAGWQA